MILIIFVLRGLKKSLQISYSQFIKQLLLLQIIVYNHNRNVYK